MSIRVRLRSSAPASSLSTLVALGIATAAITACASDASNAGADAAVAAVVGAQTAVVTTQPFTETITAMGTVVPRAGHAATLSAPVSARVTRVLVSAGQRVSAGQPLVELDAAAFEAAAHSAQAAVTAAQQNVDRTQRLVSEGVSPRKDAEAAAAELARVRADLVAARRTVQLATLRSPIPGVVTRMTASLGAMADPTQPLVEVADPSSLDILLSATPSEAGRVRPGAKVALAVGQSAAGDTLGIGTVVDIAAVVDSATRSVPVRVQAKATRRVLRIGETVFGTITVATRDQAIVIPSEALVPEGDGFKVFVVDDKGIAHARPVTVGGRTDKEAEITAGLEAGDRIVTFGAYGVDDGAKIVPPNQAGRTPAAQAPAAPAAKPDSEEKP